VTKESDEQEPAIKNMQHDISRMLVMLQSLTIPERNNDQKERIGVNSDSTAIITASNLMEAKHPDIRVDILDDGCKVSCYSCQHFYLANQKKMYVY
jgi:hypothetical protein